MFNALNRIISRLDGDAPAAPRESHGGFGFQVLHNSNLQLPIEPWFDFIVGINGRTIVLAPFCNHSTIFTNSTRTTRIHDSSPKKCATALVAPLALVSGAPKANAHGPYTCPFPPIPPL